MQDLLWQLKDISEFTVWTTAAFTLAVYLFIREIVASPMLALVSVPFLMAGGILSTVLFQHQMIVLSYDPDANVAATAGIGVVGTLVLIVIAKWLGVVFKEFRVRRTKIAPVTPASRLTR